LLTLKIIQISLGSRFEQVGNIYETKDKLYIVFDEKPKQLEEVCGNLLLRVKTRRDAEPLNAVFGCQISEDGCIVEADGSLFRHKQKYHRGLQLARELWVFVLADRGFNPSWVAHFWFLAGLQILYCLFF